MGRGPKHVVGFCGQTQDFHVSFSGGPEDIGAVPQIVMRVLDVDLSPMGATAPISIYVGMPLLVALIFFTIY